MNVTLRLRYREAPQRPTEAWWLPGADGARWLAAASEATENSRDDGAGPAYASRRWIVVPGETHGSIRGALFVPAATGAATTMTANSASALPRRVVPFGVVAGRLYLPATAEFEPAMSDLEVGELLPADGSTYVWLPVEGLVRCDESSGYAARQLVAAPPEDDVRWDAAERGEATGGERLVALEAAVPFDVDELLGETREEIGVREDGWRELPAAPGEESAWRIYLRRWWLEIVLFVGALCVAAGLYFMSPFDGQAFDLDARDAGLMIVPVLVALIVFLHLLRMRRERRGRVASKPSGTRQASTGGSGRAGSVREWVRQRRERFQQDLDSLRNREVRRLLNLLTERPDEGLRFAIPLRGDAAHRGRAGSTARLPEHSVDFSWGRLGGGRPAEVWGIEAQYQAQLSARYRELANREIGLGRHRRAAYIFAELLGDLRAAAQALADGRHFREAAAIYQQRLQDPRAAAACLEQAGLLGEAIPLYRELGEMERAGELHERLDQRDAAAACFRQAVDQRLMGGDYLGAARLLEQRLEAPDEAYATLREGWPTSSQAARCFDASFDLLGRRADHARAAREIKKLTDDRETTPDDAKLATGLAYVATQYPDATVRQLAADRTRIVAGERLEAADPEVLSTLLAALRRLVPDDQLLQRDCQRFGMRASEGRDRSAAPRGLRLVREIRLPVADWRTAVGHGAEFYVAGWRGDELLVVRGDWNGSVHQPTGGAWRVPTEQSRGRILLGITGKHVDCRVIVHLAGQAALREVREFPRTDKFSARPVGPTFPLDESVWALDLSCEGSVTVLQETPDGLLARRHRPGFQTVATHPTGFALPEPGGARFNTLQLLDANDACYLGGAAGLFAISADFAPTVAGIPRTRLVLSDTVTQLVCGGAGRYVAASLIDGARAWFGSPLHVPIHELATDLHEPRVGFLRNDRLLAAAAGRVELYELRRGNLHRVGRSPAGKEQPITVLALPEAGRAAVVTSSGQVRIYEGAD